MLPLHRTAASIPCTALPSFPFPFPSSPFLPSHPPPLPTMSRGQPLTSLPWEASRLGARLSRAWRAASAAALRARNSVRGITSPLPRMLHK
jgi:hypothetical protein